MPDDVMRIQNMRFYGYHGLFSEENKLGQHYEVDVEIFGSFEGWAAHGANPDVSQIEGGINYPEIYSLIESIVTEEVFGLAESLADRIAGAIQEGFGVAKLIVRVRKPIPPVPGHFDGIEIEVSRGLG